LHENFFLFFGVDDLLPFDEDGVGEDVIYLFNLIRSGLVLDVKSRLSKKELGLTLEEVGRMVGVGKRTGKK